MKANRMFASIGETRFVLVNDCVPRVDARCAFCCRKIEKATCANRTHGCSIAIRSASLDTPTSSHAPREKCHEMRRSGLQSQHWPRLLPARLVQQAALLFPAMPRCGGDRAAEPTAPRPTRYEPFCVAVLATG